MKIQCLRVSSPAVESQGREREEGHWLRGLSLLSLGLSFLCYKVGWMLEHISQTCYALSIVICTCAWPSAQRGSKEGLSESGNHHPFILGAVGGFGTRTAVMIKALSERHLAVWTAHRLEAGRPRESEALAGTVGGKKGLEWASCLQ